MKTEGRKHQLAALRKMVDKEFFALFHEQGTGKTWTFMADGERQYNSGRINSMLVFAPKGVHTNWVRREIPKHMDVHLVARAWRSGAGKRLTKHIEEVLKPCSDDTQPLRILSMNIDAVNTQRGYEFAQKFLLETEAEGILDESGRIKNPDARRTQAIMSLRPHMKLARIGTGTPITKAPTDVFAQMEFLQEGLLGTTSYRAFVAEYSELMSADHPMMQRMIERNPRIAHAQIVARDQNGNPIWRNLNKLQQLLLPYSDRVLKKDCLDLPDKIYKTVYFELSPQQQKAYELMRDENRLVVNDDTLAVIPLAARIKLQQLTSGFVIPPGEGAVPQYIEGKNPRLDVLKEIVQDLNGKFIVWALFREELAAIARLLRKDGYKVVEYHGGISDNAREQAVDDFQDGDADVFVAQPGAGGIGLTLTAAETAIYYSNSYDLEHRLQSEDRNHRDGTKNNVVYIDIAAIDTVDENVINNLTNKDRVATMILDNQAPVERWQPRTQNEAPRKETPPASAVDSNLLALFERHSK